MKISMSYRSIQTNLFFATILFTLFSMGSVQAQTHTPRANRAMTSNTNGYYEYLPEGYNPSGTTLHPLIIMIHGRGEYGDGGTSQLPRVTNHGLGRAIRDGQFYKSYTVNGKTHKFIVLTPQWKSQATTAQVNGVIDYALRNYKVDPKRIYLTGLSAGGGVVEMAAADLTVGKRIAAIVQFCGTGTPSSTRAANIVANNVAFWGIHNKYDDVVPSSKTVGWVDLILKTKSTFPARKTIPSSSSHNAWQSRYPASWTENNLNIYQWMLQYARGTVSTTINAAPIANAGSDKIITLPTSSVTLSGSGTDADGSIAKYAWTKIAGPSYFTFSSTTVASPTVSGLVGGTYTFRLTVTDDKGATDYDDVNVTVGAAATTYAVPGKVEAENYTTMNGVQTETTSDVGGGSNVGYIDIGDWMDYSVKTTASGTFSVRFRVASGSSTGSQFQVKNSSGTILATVNVPATGGYQTWKDVTASVKLVSGTQTLRLVSTIAARWNLNYLYFSTSTTSSPSTPTTTTKIEAEAYSSMSGVSTETTTDAGGGLNVRAIDQNDWMEYNISPSTSGTYTFTFRVATIYTGAKFDVLDAAGKVLASVTVPNTGGAQTWTNVTASVALPAGAQTIMLYSRGTYRWNINYFTFGSASGTTAGTQAATQAVEEDATATQSMAISPNPFADRFVLTVNNPYTGTMKVQLIDASGVVRKEFQVLKNAAGTVQTYLSAGTLPAGNYFLKVQMENWSQTKQVVKL